DLPLVSNVELNEMRKKCEVDIKQMYHCRQCRADAIGTLSEDHSIDFRNIGCEGCISKCSGKAEKNEPEETAPEGGKYKFAISSKSGINIDQHFGHANEFYIYSYDQGRIRLLEKRNVDKYCMGIYDCVDEEDKMSKIVRTIEDCDGVIVLRIGEEPREKLEAKNIKVMEMYDSINKAVAKAAKELEKAAKPEILPITESDN
ncbi:NifB/NifX family molybdenum-iron cluster-binding protein, partial [Clostridium luticellarii]|uniref:NifB/NifX family molybdenum-iron cluster-binding protein n=3 Tax=Clostridium luticellarii TaxID=1691940 RepID=UPI0023565165